jgi:hypothetical protein
MEVLLIDRAPNVLCLKICTVLKKVLILTSMLVSGGLMLSLFWNVHQHQLVHLQETRIAQLVLSSTQDRIVEIAILITIGLAWSAKTVHQCCSESLLSWHFSLCLFSFCFDFSAFKVPYLQMLKSQCNPCKSWLCTQVFHPNGHHISLPF